MVHSGPTDDRQVLQAGASQGLISEAQVPRQCECPCPVPRQLSWLGSERIGG